MSDPRKLNSGDIIIQVRHLPFDAQPAIPGKLPYYYKGRGPKGSSKIKVRLVTEGAGPYTSIGDLKDFEWPDGERIL